MIDIKFLRENPDAVRENMKKKFQDAKLTLVDEVIALDRESREVQQEADDLRSKRNKISKEIGALMAQGKKEEAKGALKEFSKPDVNSAKPEIKKFEVKTVIYGHLHGKESFDLSYQGNIEGTNYHLVSADYLDFKLKKIY